MAEELTRLRLEKGLSQQEMVDVIRRFHPKFGKPELSKCEHSDDYGVKLGKKVINALYREFAPELLPSVIKKRDGHHRLTKRIECRLEDEEYDELLELIGDQTMQDWLADMVRQNLKRKGSDI